MREDILKFIAHAQGAAIAGKGSIEDLLTDLEPEGEEEKSFSEGELSDSDSVIIKIANKIIREAFRLGVSDIHIEHYSGRRLCVIRCGSTVPVSNVKKSLLVIHEPSYPV